MNMKRLIKHNLKQTLTLTPSLTNQIKLLSLTGEEIRTELDLLIDNFCLKSRKKKVFSYFKDTLLSDKYNHFLRNSYNDFKDEYSLEADKDIRNFLSEQFTLLNLKKHEFLIGEYLIDSIKEDGRMSNKIDFNDLKSLILQTYNIEIKNEKIQQILHLIHQLDPIGCGFNTITESLLFQVDYLEVSEREKIRIRFIVKNIANKKVELESLSSEDIRLVRKLNFNLGHCFNQVDKEYIRPDVLAIRTQGDWKITLNDSFMSESLLDEIKSSIKDSSSEEKTIVKTFLKGFKARQNTLFLVSEFLVKKQSKFLNGKGCLIPLTLKSIGSSVGLSESTVSRILTSKYLQLQSKVIPLGALVEKSVNKTEKGGKQVTPSELIGLIKKMIKKEDKTCPLSDEKIRKYLMDIHSIDLARRTVSKYRLKANIDSSKGRIPF